MKNVTKLNLNESPFVPGKQIVGALEAGAQTVNRYPEWDAVTLRTALADHYGLAADWVIVGNGSIGVIQQAMVASGQGEIIYGWPTFEAFEIAARALRMPVKRVGLVNEACDLEQYAVAITDQTSMVIICTPNAPTGGIVRKDELNAFVAKVPEHVLVLIDEAYGEFVDAEAAIDALNLVRQYKNVMLTRTFSKAYGLAGIRVGYGIAQPQLAERITKAGLPFPVPTPFQTAALTALKDKQRLARQVERISQERHRLAAKLRTLGAEVIDGYGNFVWLPVGALAERVVSELRNHNVLAKPVMPHGVRITVGTADDTDTVCQAWERAGLTDIITADKAVEKEETLPGAAFESSAV